MADALGSGPSGSNPLEVQVLSSVLTSFAKKNKVETHFVYLLEVQQSDPFSTATRLALSKCRTYDICSKNGSFYHAWIIQISAKIRLSQKHQAKPLFSGILRQERFSNG